MSEKDAKKPAARDISDLKARLGLKKGADGAPARTTQGMTAVPPPTAAKIGGTAVPPPPGVAPPQPVKPPMPDPSVDPFGAMNAMARQAVVQQAPEIVIVNDGKPVEEVARSGKVLRYVKVGALVLAPLIVGYISGGIMQANAQWNKTIDDATRLYDDFNAVGKSLLDLQELLNSARDRGGGQFKLHDAELTAAIEGMKLKAPDTNLLFHSNMYNMDPAVVSDVFGFYMDLTVLYQKVAEHIRLAKLDERKRPDDYVVAGFRAGAFAAVLRVPQDAKQPPYVEIVELGAPRCADGKTNPQGCPGEPTGFQIRNEANGPWLQSIDFARNADQLAPDKIVMIANPDRSNDVIDAIIKGATPYLHDVGYRERLREIDEKVKELSETRARILSKLNLERNRGKRFTL